MIAKITEVWSAISTWLVGQLGSFTSIFYDSTGNALTLIGTLAVVGVGIALVFKLFNTVKAFLKLR